MGFSGLVAVSINSSVIPDLAFFSLLLKEQEFNDICNSNNFSNLAYN